MRMMILVLALAVPALLAGCGIGCGMRESYCIDRCRAATTGFGGVEECRQRCEATNACR